MTLKDILNDWNEITSIKEWRELNHISIDQRYVDKVNKYIKITQKFWIYMTVTALTAGIIIGLYS